MLLFFISCKDKNENLVAFQYDSETVPSLITDTVNTFISEEGQTRVKLVADVWMVFDKAKEPYWFFPEGIYVERYDSLFNVEATVVADTAWNYTAKNLWKLRGNVRLENKEGNEFESEEFFWDQENKRFYSDKYIEIKRNDTKVKGYGFESNQEMTEYRILRPHDGVIPIVDDEAPGGDNDLFFDSETPIDTIN